MTYFKVLKREYILNRFAFFLLHHQLLLESSIQIGNLIGRNTFTQYFYQLNKEKADVYSRNINPIQNSISWMIYLNHFRFMVCFHSFANTFSSPFLMPIMVLCYFKLGILLYILKICIKWQFSLLESVHWHHMFKLFISQTIFFNWTHNLIVLIVNKITQPVIFMTKAGAALSAGQMQELPESLVDLYKMILCRNDYTNRAFIKLLRTSLSSAVRGMGNDRRTFLVGCIWSAVWM